MYFCLKKNDDHWHPNSYLALRLERFASFVVLIRPYDLNCRFKLNHCLLVYSSLFLSGVERWNSGTADSITSPVRGYMYIFEEIAVPLFHIILLAVFLDYLFHSYLSDRQSIRVLLSRWVFWTQLCARNCSLCVQDPQYALSEGSILQVIKWAKRGVFCKVEVAK